MKRLKYKLVPKGAAEGRIPINLIFVDKKDVFAAGLSYREACEVIAKNFKESAAIDIIDMDSITVTSDGIVVDFAIVAFASIDYGMINRDFGFLQVSERPYSIKLLEEEPHMKQWDSISAYCGKQLYRGPNFEDRWPRVPHNETQTITGRIANNNTGSEVMDVVDMTEVLIPAYGALEIMKDGEVLIGLSGPEVSVGIGMVVFETYGRIFDRAYGAGKTAHNSGEYAKTVKSDYPAIAGRKSTLAEYTIRALEIGLLPGKDLGCSPAVLSIAKALGTPIAFDNIEERAWVELASVGITRSWLEEPSEKLSREEVIARADEIVPGISDGKIFKVKDIVKICYIEL
ncbi:MAG: hypothetical protein VB018_11915 [Lachnospiraceae bacterium]|nr:hypothetical protein [Lachnospiraceae bacterium]